MPSTDVSLAFDPETIRGDFPILSQSLPDGGPRLVFLDSAASSQRPRQVIDAVVAMYEQHYANVHRGIHWLSDQSTDRYEEARKKVRTFVNAPESHEVIFTRGTTESINLVARSYGDAFVASGDSIVVTEMEHHSNLVPWHQLAGRVGAEIRHLDVTDDGLLALGNLDEVVDARTKVVAVTSVSNVLGTVNPLEPIIERAHQVGAVVMVDAAQSVPHDVTDLTALGADFVAFSGHKLMGPSGVGVLVGDRGLLDSMPAFMGGGSMIRRVRIDGFEPAELPAKFEAGTPPIVPAVGLGAAIDYLTGIGMETIHAHEQRLTQRAHDVLEAVGGVTIYGPEVEAKAGIVAFTMDRIHAHDVAQLLDREGVAVRAGHHCAMPLHKRLGVGATSRASFYLYNTLDEVEQLGEGLRKAQQVFRRKS